MGTSGLVGGALVECLEGHWWCAQGGTCDLLRCALVVCLGGHWWCAWGALVVSLSSISPTTCFVVSSKYLFVLS